MNNSVSITNELIGDFLSYSTAIYNRALPDIVDGLKVAQRRVLMGMSDLNLKSSSAYCKVTKLEGNVLGRYHPQGNCSSTIINMGQQCTMRYVLTDIHGNAGGSIQTGEYAGQMVSEDPPAAPRYLEVRATEVAEKLYMDEVAKGLGDWRPNYDGTSSELVRYVPKLPALLLTGAQGIASGYACHYVPYNLSDVIAATRGWIKNKGISDKSLLAKFSHPPELPQGGRVVKDDGLVNALREGRGSITVLGEWETQDDMKWGKRSTRPALVITRLANGSSEKFLEKVRSLAEEDKLPGLLDAADHSSREGVRIVLVTKTKEQRNELITTLVHGNTGLKYNHNVNCVAVGLDNRPRTVGVKEVISTWYQEREKYLISKYSGEVDKLSEKLERLLSIIKVLDNIDKFIDILRKSKDKETAIGRVSKTWKMSRDMAQYVISVPVSTLIRTEKESVERECADVKNEIDGLKPLCHTGRELDDTICAQIASLRPLGGSTRALWMTESIPKTPSRQKGLTGEEKMIEHGKEIGLSSRYVRKWLKENMGQQRIEEKWAVHMHEVRIRSREGRKEYKQQLDLIRAEAEQGGLPKRGKNAWNAFISENKDLPIPVISAKLSEWLQKINANTDKGTSVSRTPKTSSRRSPEAPERKRSKKVQGQE